MPNYVHTWAENDLYLMADEDLIQSAKGARRSLCPVEKHPEPVILPDKPWEGAESSGDADSLQDPFYGVVQWDAEEDLFRCWYNAYNRRLNKSFGPLSNQGYSCCYAISKDGFLWEKPDVGQVMFEGSLHNNMLRFKDQASSESSSLGEQIWNVQPHFSPDTDDRYVASLFTHWEDPIFPTGITMCYSPDGIHWWMYYPPVLMLEGDCHGMCWDPNLKCYLLTTRSHQHTNLTRRWDRPWKRHIALFKSRDLIHWTAGETIVEADEDDPEDAQLYLMYIVPYGHAYLGQLLMFYGHEMVLDNQLALSRDLKRWQRVGERSPLLERGPEGSWDSRHVALTHNPPHPEGQRMRFWYAGKNAPHYQAGYGALGTATLRRDGFVCWESTGTDEAVLTTIPFRPPRPGSSTTIMLNTDASGGEVRLEMIDSDGNVVEGLSKEDCEPVTGDHTRAIISFKTGPGLFFSRGNFIRCQSDVRFRIYLRNARVYAMKVQNYKPIWPEEE